MEVEHVLARLGAVVLPEIHTNRAEVVPDNRGEDVSYANDRRQLTLPNVPDVATSARGTTRVWPQVAGGSQRNATTVSSAYTISSSRWPATISQNGHGSPDAMQRTYRVTTSTTSPSSSTWARPTRWPSNLADRPQINAPAHAAPSS